MVHESRSTEPPVENESTPVMPATTARRSAAGGSASEDVLAKQDALGGVGGEGRQPARTAATAPVCTRLTASATYLRRGQLTHSDL